MVCFGDGLEILNMTNDGMHATLCPRVGDCVCQFLFLCVTDTALSDS